MPEVETFFFTNILASGEPTTAEPTRLLRSKSLRQIPAKKGEVDRWVIYNKVDTDRWVFKEVNDSMANNSMQDTSENQNSSEGGSWAWR